VRVEPSLGDPIPTPDVAALSDDELLRRLADLVGRSRRVEADVVAHIAEVEERRLYAREASRSMFEYCTDVLHFSEPEAYLRIAVARAAREHPLLLTMLADGRAHLSGIAKLAPHLTPANRDALLARAAHKSKRQIQELVAELAPAPDAPAFIRKLPTRALIEVATDDPPPDPATPELELRPDGVLPTSDRPPARPAVIQPTAPERYKVQFTASAIFREKLHRLQALMRHAVPDGDLARILEEAVTEKLERVEARRFGRTKIPRKTLEESDTSAPGRRAVPAPVRRAVSERDDDRCRYVSKNGRSCGARDWLEFDHVQAHARGGDRSVDNIRLMCRTHNLHLAERDYGTEAMSRHRRRRKAGGSRTG
jgi:hypothetical protein